MDITEKHRIDEQGKKAEAAVLSDQQFCILYAVCHVTGMLSACANPVIYGYLNENFNREFKEIFANLKHLFSCSCRTKHCSAFIKRRRNDDGNVHSRCTDQANKPSHNHELKDYSKTNDAAKAGVEGDEKVKLPEQHQQLLGDAV